MGNTINLGDLVEQQIETGQVELPVIDNIALRIRREVNEGVLDSQGLSQILEKDPVLVVEVLKMANSSFYIGMSEIKNVGEAIVRLGLKQVASLVFSSAQKRLYSASSGQFQGKMLQLWQHASAVSVSSRWLGLQAGQRELAEDAFVSGMLHDIGKLSLLRIIEDVVTNQNSNADSAEIAEVLASQHAEHGRNLIEKWNMPPAIGEVVMHVDDAVYAGDDKITVIVRLADRICLQLGIGGLKDPAVDVVQLPEMEALGLEKEDLEKLHELLSDFTAA